MHPLNRVIVILSASIDLLNISRRLSHYVVEMGESGNSETWEDHQEKLVSLPPSAKLVVKVLELEGENTQADLIDETLLPRRTVGKCLSELEDGSIVKSRPLFTDPRQRVYTLALE